MNGDTTTGRDFLTGVSDFLTGIGDWFAILFEWHRAFFAGEVPLLDLPIGLLITWGIVASILVVVTTRWANENPRWLKEYRRPLIFWAIVIGLAIWLALSIRVTS